MSTTMDFFGHQRRARRASKWLVFLFAVAVISIIALVYLAAVLVFTYAAFDENGARRIALWNPDLLLVVGGGVLVLVFGAMLFKTKQLSSGGGQVARLLGGEIVDPGTKDAKDARLHNVVEEMAIASGIPVPEVYVLRSESGLNAFAAGWNTEDAAIAVTQGLLDRLDRDELQGVIAHEFSHVFHGDMRLNIRLMGVLFGIICLTVIGRILLRAGYVSRGGNRKGNGGGIVVFGLALLVIGGIGTLFSRLIQAAISRQREFLADASAVQYTRNPRGIGMALAKIGGLGATVKNPHVDETSHMMFADGIKRLVGGAFATHPPLTERIERVLPGFSETLRREKGEWTAAVAATPPPAAAAGFAGAGISPDAFLASVGDPTPGHVHTARELLASLPLEISTATHDPALAGPLALALLLEPEPRAREAQLAAIADADHPSLLQARQLLPTLRELPHGVRLPLLELAIPALRTLPPDEHEALRARARALALADDDLSPFELALLATLDRHLGPPRRRRNRAVPLMRHADEVAVVLSAVARAGADGDEEAARNAFAEGSRSLELGRDLDLLPRERGTASALEESVDKLVDLSELGKRNLLAACAAAASADGVIAPDELDLLRALAGFWDCPVPLLDGTR